MNHLFTIPSLIALSLPLPTPRLIGTSCWKFLVISNTKEQRTMLCFLHSIFNTGKQKKIMSRAEFLNQNKLVFINQTTTYKNIFFLCMRDYTKNISTKITLPPFKRIYTYVCKFFIYIYYCK